MDGTENNPVKRRITRTILESLAAVLFFVMALLIQDIVAQNLAGATDVSLGEMNTALNTELLVHQTD